MEKIINYKTGIEIHKKSYKVLVKELGVVDFIRFIQEFERGEGDYTSKIDTRWKRWWRR